jgi:hypothetical protein
VTIVQICDIREFFYIMVDYDSKSHLNKNTMMYLGCAALMSDLYLEACAYMNVDCAEILGGMERVTHLLIRRLHRHGFKPGVNCDYSCHLDLDNYCPLDPDVWGNRQQQQPSVRPRPAVTCGYDASDELYHWNWNEPIIEEIFENVHETPGGSTLTALSTTRRG